MELSRKTFEKLVAEALDRLPERFRTKLDNVAIIIEDEPTPEQREAHGVGTTDDEVLFGLYEGSVIRATPLFSLTKSRSFESRSRKPARALRRL
jgi:predicted Zn-dependent protease with MMP-like domain